MLASTQVPPSQVSIDWMSWSIPVKFQENKSSEVFGLHGQMMTMLKGALDQLPDTLVSFMTLKAVTPRPPFHYSFQCTETKIRLSTSTAVDYVHIEIPGTGCAALRSLGLEDVILRAWGTKFARLDLAVDIECNLDPRVVSDACESGRIKTRSEFSSEEGITCYLGSMKSDRYCRVYRYRPPHERAHLLRVEFVHKDRVARELAKTILTTGRIVCARIALEGLKCSHPVIIALQERMELSRGPKSYMPERRESNTVKWLKDQVVPSLVRLEEEGEVEDALEFLTQLVIQYRSNLNI